MITINYINNDVIVHSSAGMPSQYIKRCLDIYKQLYFCKKFTIEKNHHVVICSYSGTRKPYIEIRIGGGENLHGCEYSFNLEKGTNINKYNSMIRYFMYNINDLRDIDGELLIT